MAGAQQPHPLFGGALSAVIPPTAIDLGFLDHQDFKQDFVHVYTDQTLTVELVEFEALVADQDANRYYYEDIIGINNALPAPMIEPILPQSLPECISAWMLKGVSMFNGALWNYVDFHLGVFRLPHFATDVLISFNNPHIPGAAAPEIPPWSLEDFRRLLQTLTLHDPSSFDRTT